MLLQELKDLKFKIPRNLLILMIGMKLRYGNKIRINIK